MKCHHKLAALVFCLSALGLHAETITGDEASCETLGGVAMFVTDMKNRGVPWELISQNLAQTISEAKGQKGSIIQDDSDAALVMRVMQLVYDGDETVPEDAGRSIYKACMKASIRV